MRPKSLVLLLLALGCGLVASIGISQVLDRRNQNSEPVVEKEPIFVALKDIKVNEPIITDKNVKLEDWPKDKIPSDAIRDAKDYLNQRAGSTILAGEPVRKAKFANDDRMKEIPKGYRVEAVPADAVSAIGNLLQPGDRVDVVLTLKHTGSTNNQVAKTILQDVRVFAVNEQWRTYEGGKGDETIPAKTVSLLLTSAQAETIALAESMGKIRLVLRNPDDNEVSATAGTDESEILSGSRNGDRGKEWGNSGKTDVAGGVLAWLNKTAGKVPNVPAPTPPQDPIQRFRMELFKGDEMHEVEFTRKGNDARWSNSAIGSPLASGGPMAGASSSSPLVVPISSDSAPQLGEK